jgi:uncharacterized protein (TIGR02001 family)
LVVRHHGYNGIDIVAGFPGRGALHSSPAYQVMGSGCGSVEHSQLMTAIEQTSRHSRTHSAQPDECHSGHIDPIRWHVVSNGAILRAANGALGKIGGCIQAMLAEGRNRGQRDYSLWGAVSLSAALLIGAPRCVRAQGFGGSLDVTSDYLVRGISRSDDHSALQLALHYLDPSGFVADFFASNTQSDPDARRDAELSAFVGYDWPEGRDWQGKILVGEYRYPWNQAGSFYNYDEITIETRYRDWLRVDLGYSPDTWRYYYERGAVRGQAEWVELSLQHPLIGKLSGTAGVGYYELDGTNARGYGYWSIGAAYDIAPVTLALSFVGASSEANSLFYNAAVGGRWSATAIWRF